MHTGAKTRVSDHKLKSIWTEAVECAHDGDDMTINRWLMRTILDELMEHRATLERLGVVMQVAVDVQRTAQNEREAIRQTYGRGRKPF